MRKITQLLLLFLITWTSTVFAKTNTLVPTYLVEQYFTSAAAYPTGWSAGTNLYGGSGAVSWTSPASNQLNVSGSGNGSRGLTINTPSSGTTTELYISFDWYITSQVVAQKNAIGLAIHGSSGTTNKKKNILISPFGQ